MCAHHTSQSPQFDWTELVVLVCICIVVRCLQGAASEIESIYHKNESHRERKSATLPTR